MKPLTTKLAGVTFDDCQENIHLYGGPAITIYELTREPGNIYDSNAISVDIGPYKFGYVPSYHSEGLALKMDEGRRFRAEFVSINRSPFHEPIGMTVKITELTN